MRVKITRFAEASLERGGGETFLLPVLPGLGAAAYNENSVGPDVDLRWARTLIRSAGLGSFISIHYCGESDCYIQQNMHFLQKKKKYEKYWKNLKLTNTTNFVHRQPEECSFSLFQLLPGVVRRYAKSCCWINFDDYCGNILFIVWSANIRNKQFSCALVHVPSDRVDVYDCLWRVPRTIQRFAILQWPGICLLLLGLRQFMNHHLSCILCGHYSSLIEIIFSKSSKDIFDQLFFWIISLHNLI